MVQREMQITTLLSFPEKEYNLGGYSTIVLVPSIVLAYIDKRSSYGDSNPKVGYNLCPPNSTFSYKFWEIHCPLNAKQAINGLRLLAECPKIVDDTLCACYYASNCTKDSTTNRYIDSLKTSGFPDVEKHRARILNETIDEDVLIDGLLNPLIKAGISIDDESIATCKQIIV